MTELSLSGVSFTVDGKRILNDIDLSIGSGELVVLLGANGAGKSSLLRCGLGLERQASGEVHLDKRLITSMTNTERAKRVAYLPQKRPVAWPLRVFDVVSLGRYAYGVRIGRLKGDDRALVEKAIIDCDLNHLRDRRIDTLSGGESARVHCARAFAANATLLLADEPIASLDPRHQIGVMKLIRNYVDGGSGALVVAHEASLAARFADRLLWMRDGKIINDGSVSETMTESMMAEVYGVSAQITTVDGRTTVVVLNSL